MFTEIGFDIEDLKPMEPEITPYDLGNILLNERNVRLVVDIETRPASEETLVELFKEEEVKLPSYPGEFNPMKVKYGNTIDPKKREAKLADAITKHELKLATWDEECEAAKTAAWEDFKSKAALKPNTGRIFAINYGLKRGTETQLCLDVDPDNERIMLMRFWRFVDHIRRRSGKLVSFNGHGFDIPFCTWRSWCYEDVTPVKLITKYNKFEDCCIDCLIEYRMGGSWSNFIKLGALAKMMGFEGKLDGVTGAELWNVYNEDPERAFLYMARDIYTTVDVAERMRLI